MDALGEAAPRNASFRNPGGAVAGETARHARGASPTSPVTDGAAPHGHVDDHRWLIRRPTRRRAPGQARVHAAVPSPLGALVDFAGSTRLSWRRRTWGLPTTPNRNAKPAARSQLHFRSSASGRARLDGTSISTRARCVERGAGAVRIERTRKEHRGCSWLF